MPVAVTVRPARQGEADALAAILAQAFHPLPPARWLIGDSAVRGRCLPDYFAIFAEHAMDVGHVDVAASRRSDRPLGVALWWAGDDSGGPPDYDTRLANAVPPECLDRFGLLDALMDHAHPKERTGFEYLAFLAVRPTVQGCGIGTMLLRSRHRQLDSTGTAAFLQAATLRSRDLYQRHGYQPISDPINLPPHGPPLWPMWREPVPSHWAPRDVSQVARPRSVLPHNP